MGTIGRIRRGRSRKTLAASYHQYRDRFIPDLARQMLPPGATDEQIAQKVSELEGFYDGLIDGLLPKTFDVLKVSDNVYVGELARDGTARSERDETRKAVYKILAHTRKTGRDNIGDEFLAQWGLGEPVPEEAEALVTYAEAAENAIGRVEMPPLKEGVPSAMASREDILRMLSDARPPFETAYEKTLQEARRTEEAMLTRRRLVKAHDAVFLRVARILEDSYRLVGLDEEADRIRPSRRRPGLFQSEEDEPYIPDDDDDDVVVDGEDEDENEDQGDNAG